MEEQLKSKILELIDLLKQRKNENYIFLETLVLKIEQKLISEVVIAILPSSAMTQYANYNYKEVKIFSEIWEIANQIKSNMA